MVQIPQRPEEFHGSILLVLPSPNAATIFSGWLGVPGWTTAVTDSYGKLFETVSALNLHLDTEGASWAELYMYVKPDGSPAERWEDMEILDDGPQLGGPFAYYVVGFVVADDPSSIVREKNNAMGP